MIKNIAYFPSQCALNSIEPMRCFLQSLADQGIKTVPDGRDADAAVIWSVLWKGRMRHNQQVYDHYRAQNKPVIVIDVGTLIRNHTWKIAINNINRLGQYGHEQDLDWDRPRALGISLSTVRRRDQILIALQNSHSLQVSDIGNMKTWIEQQVRQLKQHTDRALLVRPHPRCHVDLSSVAKFVTVIKPKLLPNTYDEFDLDCGYHAVVNHNSGPGIRAALVGSRPLVSESSLAYPVSINISTIESPYDIDRDLWLVQICHTEYTLEEISQGLWLKRLANWLTM